MGNVIPMSGEDAGRTSVPVTGAEGTRQEPLPAELTEAISTIDNEVNGNFQVLNAQLAQAERTQRETLKALDGLFDRLGRRLQDRVDGVQRQCETIQSGYDGAQRHFQGYQQRYDDLQRQYAEAQQQFEGVQHRYDGVQQQFKGIQRQHESLREDFQAVRQSGEAVVQQVEGIRKTAEETEQRCGGLEQKLSRLDELDKRLVASADELAALRTSLEEEGRRRGNVEISIGEMSKEIGKLGASEMALLKEEIEQLRAAGRSGRKRQRLGLAVALLALMLAGYVGLGKPGFTSLSQALTTFATPKQ